MVSKINIIHGDCIETMATIGHKAFDYVLTDPPYNIDFTYNEYKDNLTEESYVELLSNFQYPKKTIMIHYPEETMQYLIPALGIPEKVMAWCYNSNLPRQFRLINFFNCKPDLNKIKQPFKNPTDKRIHELIKNGQIGCRSYDWFSDIQLVKNVSQEKTEHPCPVPVELMKRIILMTTNENDTIFDPFAGTGTTGIACIETNRNFIGCEINKDYYAAAVKRLDNHQKQGRLF